QHEQGDEEHRADDEESHAGRGVPGTMRLVLLDVLVVQPAQRTFLVENGTGAAREQQGGDDDQRRTSDLTDGEGPTKVALAEEQGERDGACYSDVQCDGPDRVAHRRHLTACPRSRLRGRDRDATCGRLLATGAAVRTPRRHA